MLEQISYPNLAMQKTLKINEIFHSIQGETSYAGFPTTFIRTSGCHLRCTYCDTTYAYYQGKKLGLAEILQQVDEFGAGYVCVTGGEPLLQENVYDLMTSLCDRGLRVSLETSGAVACHQVDPRVKMILDVKTPDSGEPDTFETSNLDFANERTEFKFVICSERDFEWAEEFAKANNLFVRSNVLYSPSFGKIEEKWLAEKILHGKSRARLQLQLHKYIWSPRSRGV